MKHLPTTCEVSWLRKETNKNNKVEVFYCKTHSVEICRCGAEWGNHKLTGKINIDNLLLALYKNDENNFISI